MSAIYTLAIKSQEHIHTYRQIIQIRTVTYFIRKVMGTSGYFTGGLYQSTLV